jgi:hypothetical protein
VLQFASASFGVVRHKNVKLQNEVEDINGARFLAGVLLSSCLRLSTF